MEVPKIESRGMWKGYTCCISQQHLLNTLTEASSSPIVLTLCLAFCFTTPARMTTLAFDCSLSISGQKAPDTWYPAFRQCWKQEPTSLVWNADSAGGEHCLLDLGLSMETSHSHAARRGLPRRGVHQPAPAVLLWKQHSTWAPGYWVALAKAAQWRRLLQADSQAVLMIVPFTPFLPSLWCSRPSFICTFAA